VKNKKITFKPAHVKKIQEALRAAELRAKKDHQRTGNPLVFWKNGRVVKILAR
jgi:hypothetical protein